MSARTAFWGIVFVIAISLTAEAQTRRKTITPGQRAIVVDERLSALRAQPDIKASLVQRLRRGRVVGILSARKSKDGESFLRVSVTRNTRGWVLAEAVVKAGNAAEAERLLNLIEDSDDDFVKARLARLCANEFRATVAAPRCLLKLGETAERVADRLTRDAKRRIGNEEPSVGLSKRDYFLNFVGLDRYNRIGVLFEFDASADRIVYDGEAYRELIRRYPKSNDAGVARKKLEVPASR